MKNKTREKIDNIDATLMIGTALLIDGTQIFLTLILIGPFVNWLISIFAWMTFFLWFMLKGIKFTNNPKKIFTFMGGSLMEVIPIVASLPTWTATVTTIIFMEKAEKKLKSTLGKQLGSPMGKVMKNI